MYRGKASALLLIDTDEKSSKDLSSIISSDFDVVKASPKDDILSILQDSEKGITAAAFSIDIALPLLKDIRTIPPLQNLPVIIISNDSDAAELAEKEDELLRLDVVDFLCRSYRLSRIRNIIKNVRKLSEANLLIDELERDELTGVLTRQAFLRKCDFIRSENPQKAFSVIACDFDNFKSSNTIYGEEKCNEFLAFVGTELKRMLPEAIIGRFGGDQFVILTHFKGEVDVKRINTIQTTILGTAPIPHQIAKIGVYGPIDFELPFIICCDRAFLAIREIKGIYNKNIAFYESGLQKQLLDEQHIIETMERGLDEEQFRIFYQPKHESISGGIAGAEALVRWEHPEYGFLSPNQFIPIFERNGFISKLDLYILTQVCKDIKRWQQNGLPIVPVSVNISRRDFLEPGCIDREIQIVDELEVDHSLLHMEVTESLYSDNTELIISQVKKFQDSGFLIEMDDFGAGYSSLGSLSSFPLNVIKLDISFVRNLKANEIVIENIIKMAHRMGLMTVAEGAESTEQFKTLKTLGCDFIQGFYFSKPLSAKNYESYLKKTSVSLGLPTMPTKAVGELSILNDTMLMAANEVAEAVPGGFFSYHADGNLELISFNRELLNIYECDTAEELRELCGNSFKGLVYEEDFERIQQSISEQITPEHDIDYVEYRIKTKKGKIKNIKDYGRFVKTEKYGDIFYVFVNDTTEEDERKEEIKETRNENRSKTIFMYNVAKEILEPMKNLISSTNYIRENLSDTELVNRKLDEAGKSEEHLLTFINNILEFAKIERGDITLKESATDISLAAKQSYDLLAEEAEKRGITLEYWSEFINPYIYQDVIHTTDVVMNIIHNAMKYTPAGGKVRFGIRQLPGKNDDECIVQFVCEDSGIGISKEFLPHIYDAFEKEDNQINKDNPSSGLGLNVAKILITLMKGTIEVTSEPGKGTTVKTSQPHRYAKKEDVTKETLLRENM
ncbi:MAG: EAL domain-containing protein [Treponema sp.]|nr:EAL domain-containing protein [Treponema sp.]